MLYLEHLVEAGEHDFMLADDGAAADGGDADLMLPARLAHAVALEGELRLVGQGLRRGLRYHQRGAAGGVHLAAVVALDDLDVEIRAQDGRRPAHEVKHEVDAEGHVAALENGHLLRGGVDLRELLRGIARGAEDDGYLPLHGEAQQGREVGGVGEVYHHVGLARVLHGVGVHGEAVAADGCAVEAGHDLDILHAGADVDDGLAHMAVAAGDDHLQHGGYLRRS